MNASAVMSHETVRAFYRQLAADPTMVVRYTALCGGLLGVSAKKVVAFAGCAGFDFSREELEFVRLTNRERGTVSLGRSSETADEIDLESTASPHPPHDAGEFRSEHGRAVG